MIIQKLHSRTKFLAGYATDQMVRKTVHESQHEMYKLRSTYVFIICTTKVLNKVKYINITLFPHLWLISPPLKLW